MREVDPEVERIARLIAFWHGGRITGPSQTIATRHGYGSFGDAASNYMNGRWHEYINAAEQVIEEFKPKAEPSQ